jgi:hypothetical protein
MSTQTVLVNRMLHSAREGSSRAMLGTTDESNTHLSFLCQKHVQHLVDQYRMSTQTITIIAPSVPPRYMQLDDPKYTKGY